MKRLSWLALLGGLTSCVITCMPARGEIVLSYGVIGAGGGTSVGDGLRVGSTLGEPAIGRASGSSIGSLGFWLIASGVGAGPGGTTPLVADFLLAPAEPNPFRGSTRLHFELPRPGPVRLSIYDLNGRRRRTLIDREESAGTKEVVWDARDDAGHVLPTGVYFYRLETRGFRDTQKLVRIE